MKIVFLDQSTVTLGDVDFSSLVKLGEYAEYPQSTEDEIIERAKDAQVVIANKAPLTKRVIDSLKHLKLITIVATGYNNVDLAAARAAGVTVCNIAGYSTTSVCQQTFAFILNLATRMPEYHADVMGGKWQKSKIFTMLTYPTFELAGKTIGIIGFGAIGQGVAKLAEAFGMRVLVHGLRGVRGGIYPNTELDTLLRESDVVTVHVALTEQTRNLIDAKAIEKMKRSAIVINTARGGIINEQALAEALNSGRLAGAGVDVLSTEPPREGNVLLSAKNILITPHSAWSTCEARQRLIEETVKNIKAFEEGRARNVVS